MSVSRRARVTARPTRRRWSLQRHVGVGLAAGAAGTTALDAVTFLDMALRGRPASSTPEQSVERLSEAGHVPVPGEGETRQSRLTGLGALTGTLTGLAVGAGYGVVRHLGWRPSLPAAAAVTTGAALLGANGGMVVTGVTDPRRWGLSDWLADLVPHVAYGVVTAATFAAAEDGHRRRGGR